MIEVQIDCLVFSREPAAFFTSFHRKIMLETIAAAQLYVCVAEIVLWVG